MRIRRLAAALFAAAAYAHEPITTKLTFTQEISRILYKRCAGCHRDGGAAPMPLITYEQTRPWAKAIRDEVLERRMPPWDAVKGFGEFRNDVSLSLPEIDMLVSWVEGGAPEGDPVYLPSLSEPGADAPHVRGALRFTAPLVLKEVVELLAIRPEGEMEVRAVEPDGTIRELLWVRRFHPKTNRDYEFRSPILLSRGTRIDVFGPNGAKALISARKPGR